MTPREGTPQPSRIRLAELLQSLLWPAGETGIKLRVFAAMALVLAAKLIGIAAPLLYKQLVDTFSSNTISVAPIFLLGAFGLAGAASQLAAEFRQLVFVTVAQRAIRTMIMRVFVNLHALSLRFHLDRKTGGISRAMGRGATSIEFLLELILFNVLPTCFEIVLIVAVLWGIYDASYALVTLCTVVAYLAFTIVVTQWQTKFRRERNRLDAEAATKAIDSLLNYETVKYSCNEAHEAQRFEHTRRDYEHAATRYQLTQFFLNGGRTTIIAAGSTAIIIMAGKGVVAGAMTIGDFVLVNSYLALLYAPISTLSMVYNEIKQWFADVEEMIELTTRAPEVSDRPDAQPLIVQRGHIVFDRVSFAYDPRRPILSNLSFEIPPGNTIAIVGASGGGKSTLARLLFRFYDVSEGAITIDGQDIRNVTQLSLHQAIGVVPQDTVLFNDTLYYNIAYGRVSAGREEVEHAARLAKLTNLIHRLPDGFQTQVGERGLKLSGGEKQRVAIARVILKKPSVLIFDEATSSLDTHTEQDILASLRDVSIERSTLIIAHRLSTVAYADEILVVDSGQIVERGSHTTLIAQDGAYAAMWRRQRRAVPNESLVPEIAE